MYKKKYGRMTVSAWINSELEQTSPILMLFSGLLLLVIGWAVRLGVGAPYRMILELGIGDLMPAVWMMALLWSVELFCVGCAAGFVLGHTERGCRGEKYKGCLLVVLLSLLEMLWYPTFFSLGLIFLTVLLSIVILCLAVSVTACFYRVSKFAGMILLLHDVWLAYMLILNLFVLLSV